MARIKYIGSAHYRELGTADLKKFGVEDFTDTTWARDEPTDVSQAVADALLQNLPDEFVAVEEERAFIPGQRSLAKPQLDDQAA